MSPLEKAKECFGECFDSMLAFAMDNGFVYSGSDAFAMAIPHNKASLMGQNLNKHIDECDCRLVLYVSGRLERLMDLLDGLPHEFEWIVFERDDEDTRYDEEHQYKCYKLQRLMEIVSHGKS